MYRGPAFLTALVSVSAVCLSSVGAAVSFPQPQTFEIPLAAQEPGDLGALLRDRMQLSDFTLQNFALPAEAGERIAVTVNLGGVAFDLDLRPYSMRSDDFRVLVQGEDGQITEVEPPPVATYRGDALQDPGSRVTGSLVRGGLSAIVETSDGLLWGIQPLTEVVEGADPAAHVVYVATDVIPHGMHCGNDHFPEFNHPEEFDDGREGQDLRGGTVRITDIGFDADVEFYNQNGSSVPNTVNDIENIANRVETIYETQVDIAYEVTTIVVRTAEPDPYSSTNAGTLLGQFQAAWNTAPFTGIRRDVAHLMTGKNMGGILGIARLPGPICTTSTAYGLSRSRWSTNLVTRTCLTAHELGHNWAATHCDGQAGCSIMCSGLGGCGGSCTSFGQSSINQIVAHRNGRSCLAIQQDPIVAPFFDDFASGALSNVNWSFNLGATVSNLAENEPSDTFSVLLNASSAADFRDDDLRTNFVQLLGVPTPQLSYFVQHRGVEEGEQLVVEYWASNVRWVEINRITSDGVDEDTFTQYTHSLTGNAVHNEFRVRFRPEVTETNDSWFVDNVRIGEPLPPPPTCPPDWNGDEAVTSDDFFAFLSDFFLGDADYNDDGVTNSDDYFAFLAAFFEGC